MKDFIKVFNHDKVAVYSPTYKFGEYDWSIASRVQKYPHNNSLWFFIFLCCESINQSDFPVFANTKYSILNKDKDSRKNHSKSDRLIYYTI